MSRPRSGAVEILTYLQEPELRGTIRLTTLERRIVDKVLDLGSGVFRLFADEVGDKKYILTPATIEHPNGVANFAYSIYVADSLNPLLESRNNGVNKLVEIFATYIGYVNKYPDIKSYIYFIFETEQRDNLDVYIKSLEALTSLQDLSANVAQEVPVNYRRRHLPTSVINKYEL